MKMRTYAILLSLALVTARALCAAQSDRLNAVIKWESTSADLASTLANVAWQSHLPMIAELAQPLPKIEVAEGTYVVKDLLQGIARQAPEYQWRAEGGAIHFYDRELAGAKFNFLNLRFSHFAMPNNVSELKLILASKEFGLLRGYSGSGFMITGFGDALLQKNPLRPAALENVTGREILFRAANESPTFFTVIVFPNVDPTRKQMERDMNRNWFWQSLKEQPGPLYVHPPASTRE